MSDISELERRLTNALDRISKGAAQLAAAEPVAVVDTAALGAAQSENEALKERVLRLEQRALRLTDRLEDAETETSRLQQVIYSLREHCDALSAANAANQGAGEAINAAMAAEVAELRASRKADIAKMDEILAEMAPAVKEA